MKVSCIMPTRDRREFVPLALASFVAQEWPHKELIVVDDGHDSIADMLRLIPHLVYVGTPAYVDESHRTIGAKRNLACEHASGEIICHWDDDDWSAPGRITDQVAMLLGSRKAVAGYSTLLFWEEAAQQASRYSNEPIYALGSSLMYRREWWQAHRFPHSSIGEDNAFVHEAHQAGELATLPDRGMMVARIHPGNTSAKAGPLRWPAVKTSEIPADFFTPC